MSGTIILVHGAWHGQWCWRHVTPLLKNLGYQVITPDLPGHGENKMDFKKITLATYVDYLTTLIQAQTVPVILVGHSLAGVVISQVAENIPHLIDKLIYIAAYLPKNNESILDQTKSRSLKVVTELDTEKNSIHLRLNSTMEKIFYNDCNQADITYAKAHLQPEPYSPMTDILKISPEKFGKIKKVYLECLQDNLIPIEDQRRMAKAANCESIPLTTGHSPFFADAKALVSFVGWIRAQPVIHQI